MIVLTMGTFDLFHVGHVRLLERCAWLAGRHPWTVPPPSTSAFVVVGLNTDEFVERYKGRPPVVAYADREAVLAACRHVDAVVPNSQPDGSVRGIVEAIAPNVIAVGSDWEGRDYLGQIGLSSLWLESRRISLVYFPYTDGISTTAIRGKIA